jgi:hypothetical protein
MIRNPWRAGAAASSRGPYVISATRFVYRRWRDMPRVWLIALRLRRGWPSRPGAVGLATGADVLAPVTYSLSVWESEDDLRAFLRSPEHARLMRDYRDRLVEARVVSWRAERFAPGPAWAEGLARLAAAAR